MKEERKKLGVSTARKRYSPPFKYKHGLTSVPVTEEKI